MSIKGRVRVKTLGRVSGTMQNLYVGPPVARTMSLGESRCEDVAGNRLSSNYLYIRHHAFDPCLVTGNQPFWPVYRFDNYPTDNQAAVTGHLPEAGTISIPSANEAVTRVAALTNPARPEISVPQFIAEMKDIPGALHARGKDLAKFSNNRYRRAVGRQNRAHGNQNSVADYNFGWGPLVGDLWKMLDFVSHAEKRLKELQQLRDNGGLRRKRTLLSESVVGPVVNDVYYHSLDGIVWGGYTDTTSIRVWASVHWIPIVPILRSDAELLAQARAYVHGWDFSGGGIASTLWELLPWSWFADYFLNMGDFLMASRNQIEFIPADCCRMVHTRTVRAGRLDVVSQGLKATVPSSTYEEKTRHVGVLSLGFQAPQPFLAAKRLLTLASIAANRS